jgi:hypothetical protein
MYDCVTLKDASQVHIEKFFCTTTHIHMIPCPDDNFFAEKQKYIDIHTHIHMYINAYIHI